MGTSPLFEEENKNFLNNNNSIPFTEEELKKIELLPTFNKLSVSQALLKEMVSKKERFEENKSKMIDKIRFYCYTYYKYIVLSKEIDDNSKKDDLNEKVTYVMINNASKSISEEFYMPIYNFLFFLRNNTKYMLTIINRCHTRYIKKLSYFIAHFCYENTINNNNSFIQEELLIIIYFLIEKIIYKSPEDILNYNKDIFLYYLLECLVRKPDIKNYLDLLLSESILQLERGKNSFILELIKKEKNEANKIKNQNQKKLLVQKGKMQADIIFLDANKNEKISNDKKQTLLNNNNLNENTLDKIDHFFISNDVSSTYISSKLSSYENMKEKDLISFAMIHFLEINFNLLISKAKEDDKFRNNYFFTFFNPDKNEKSEEKMKKKKYIENTKKMYEIVITFIVNLIIKIEKSISLIPEPLKNILSIIEPLIEKKMPEKEKASKIIFFKLMAKLKIFIGNIILPIIHNYYYNRILDEHILSRSTAEILKTVEKIFSSLLLGKLFDNNEEPEYTIYNKFIIDFFPKILNIALNLGNNIKQNINDDFPSISKKLLNSFDQIKENSRIIEYNELKDKDKNKENIEYQSICFNMEIIYMLSKTIEKEKDYFINDENTKEGNKIFKEILRINKELYFLSKTNIMKKEYQYFFIDKIIYKKDFQQKIDSILQDNFEIDFKSGNKNITRFKKCLSTVLGYVEELHKENFSPFITPNENIQIYSNIKTKLFLNYKKNKLYEKIEFDISKDNKINNKPKEDNKPKRLSSVTSFEDTDKFFSRRKSVMSRCLSNPVDDIKDETDFKSVLFPEIMSLVKAELGTNFESEKLQRIIFCLSYVQTHFDSLPVEYRKNNYSKVLTEIITDTKILIQYLQNNILNEFFMKIRYTEKINEIVNKYYSLKKIKEKTFYIKYLYKKIKVYGNIFIQKNESEMITKIKYNHVPMTESKLDFINSFLHQLPNIIDYEPKMKTNEDFLKFQKNIGLVDAIKDYFKELKNSIKSSKILSKISLEEATEILYELENHILKKLYSKCFPTKEIKEDTFIYKKCMRLSFIKPDNIIKDEKFKNINEKLLEISIDYVKEMDNKNTPMGKITSFGNAMNFLSNSMKFNSGKEGFGVDDILPLLIYIVIKAKPKKLYTNYNYSLLYLNSELSKKRYGSLLTQIGVILDIIKNMKYNELNNVTKEEFGEDEEI